MTRLFSKLLLGLVVLLLLVAAGGYAWLRQSLPQLDGKVALAGIGGQVEIVRDAEGIPHVFATSERDGWFAVGYLHAQDRLWQMELQRRLAQGRVSEVLGERAFEVDRLYRTLGLARTAEAIVAKLDPETRGFLEAYSAGVNAFLAADPVLPIEFQALRTKPEPWKPADCVSWLFAMSWDLSGNWRAELSRMRYIALLGEERAGQFMPPYPGDTATPLPDYGPLFKELAPTATALLQLSPGSEEAIGSNNWVVSGERSMTGKPLVANDPHLGLQAPALWYLVHVSTPAGNVVGGTLPGLPFVVLGRNDHVAWGFTTTNSDTQDLFIEKLVGEDRYRTPQGDAAFVVRDEVIRVGKEERRIRVRSTRHGPVVSEAIRAAGQASPRGHVMALAWAALTDENTAIRAGFRLNRARNRDELLAAAREFTAPHQNVVFADRDGHIGFVAPARVPVRRADNEAMGRVPVPGWDAKYDWQGFLGFEDLPAIQDPPSGAIVTANHKITPPGYKPFISADWYLPYRAERIEELLQATQKHSLESFARIQGDTRSRLAQELLAVARAAQPQTPQGKELQATLLQWNGEAAMDSPAPLAFAAWYREVTRLVYADELGDLFTDAWDQRAGFMIPVLTGVAGYERWCDDVRTSERETCAMLTARAFDLAAADLGRRFGGGLDRLTWGEAHVAGNDHRPFGFVAALAPLFNVAPKTPGDGFTVNVGSFVIRDEARPYANKHAASLRALYDLADLDRSLYMQATGQSGNVLSPWYRNFAERWAKVQYITIPADRARVGAAHTLTLVPRAPPAAPS